jgi:hypothetical protein
VSKVGEWHATGSIPFRIPCLRGGVIILIHLVKEGVLIVEPTHIPLFLDVIDVHLHIETLVELLSRNVVGRPSQFGVVPLAVNQAESLRRPRFLLGLVKTPVGLLEGLDFVLIFHFHLLKCRVYQVVWVVIAAGQV